MAAGAKVSVDQSGEDLKQSLADFLRSNGSGYGATTQFT